MIQMSKRLEEIKTSTINICSCESCYCDGFTLQWVGVEPEHFEWLVEEAEHVEELAVALNDARKEIFRLKNVKRVDVDHPSNKFF